MAQNGCQEIAFTPHMNPDVYPKESEAHFREVYAAFTPRIPQELGITTSLAAEYMVVNGFEDRVASEADTLLTYPDGSILIEMSYMFRSKNLEQAIFELNMAGLNPVLAHPERYLYMSDCLRDFDKILDEGCRLQLNYASLTGKYGSDSIKIMCHLLEHDMYSFVSTDLHSYNQLLGILEEEPLRKVRKAFESRFAE